MNERIGVVFPRDTLKIMRAAYRGAASIIVNTFPDHHTTNEGIHAVAHANYAEFSPAVWTEDPKMLKLLFLETFMSGYDSTGQFFEQKPANHQAIKNLSEDERLIPIDAMFNSWYEALGKRTIRRVERARKKKATS